MTLKIISNPYTQEIHFFYNKDQAQPWEDIKESNANSKLREYESERNFFPFRIKEIIDTIISEYYIDGEKISIQFEGTQDEYVNLENVCAQEDISDKIDLFRTDTYLENARIIFDPIKEIFNTVHPIIVKIIRDDKNVRNDLNKVADALKDIIPICVFGNYSAGKSSFINALIGSEILPSGGDPITAKVYKIERSKFPDNAKIKFKFKDEPFEILFEGIDYHLLNGNTENELIQDIFNAINESNANNMNAFVSIALKLINGYEKTNKDEIIISNEIDIEIPFSKNGILGQSYNNFVIFDTPGSNSESNAEHYKVLEEALEGFSNGIPVWISTYESIDSTDNASLCEKILNIEALDKRFTMIILNKADGSDLDKNGFSPKKEQEILEYRSVEKMYASGIYFVSSIMGLGAKNNGILTDNHYRMIYRSQKEIYENPEDMDYTTLYKYNIMPYQLKKNVEKYSVEVTNLVYANSGLYCVEQEIENFASRHAAYNKCQMVYMFLKKIIASADEEITRRTNILKNDRDTRNRELENKKSDLIGEVHKASNNAKEDFDIEANSYIKKFISENMTITCKTEALESITETLYKENVKEQSFFIQEKEYEDSKSNLFSNVKKNSKDIFGTEGNILDKLGKMKADFVHDYKSYMDSKTDKNIAEKEINKKTSDELLLNVINQYKNDISKSQEILSCSIKEFWQQKSYILRDKLAKIITESDALSSTQQKELSNIIISYQPLCFQNDADDVFIKARFLKGNLFGIQLIDDEKLNIRKLAHSYNTRISKAIKDMSATINASCSTSFKNWEKNLSAVIEENITEYNPDLRNKSFLIKEDVEKITELEDNQSIIQRSFSAIEELMSWKVLE